MLLLLMTKADTDPDKVQAKEAVNDDNDYNDDDNGKYRSSLVEITDREEAKEASWKQNKNRQTNKTKTKKHFI